MQILDIFPTVNVHPARSKRAEMGIIIKQNNSVSNWPLFLNKNSRTKTLNVSGTVHGGPIVILFSNVIVSRKLYLNRALARAVEETLGP